MEKAYKNCQSCSMPLGKAPGAGTEKDGSKSTMYCAYCYENGAFKQPDWDVKQMQSFVKGKMQEMHIPGFLAGLMTKGIPRLKRWKTHRNVE